MDDTYIAKRLDDVHDRLSDIDKTLAVNTELLAVHIKRTDLLETALNEHKEKSAKQMDEALIPIRASRVGFSISKWISALGAAGSAIWAMFRHFRP